jgi:hypothetical protein
MWNIGGVGLAIIIDTVIAIVLLAIFILVLQPCLVLYNTRKKRELLKETVIYENALTGNTDPVANEQVGTEEKDVDDKCTSGSWWRQPLSFFTYRFMFLYKTTKNLVLPRSRRKDRAKVSEQYGRDVATYLYFQQQIIYATLLCTLIGLVVFIPLHMTGTYPPLDTTTTGSEGDVTDKLVKVSIEMRINEPAVQSAHVILSVLFILIFAFFTILMFMRSNVVSEVNYMNADTQKVALAADSGRLATKYTTETKSQTLRNRYNMMGTATANSISDTIVPSMYLTSPYCLSIESIPSDMDQATFHKIVMDAATHAGISENLAKIALIPNFNERVEKQNVLVDLKHKKNVASYVHEHKPNKKQNVSLWCHKDTYHNSNKRKFKQKYAANEYYEKMIDMYESEVNNWDTKYDNDLDNNMSGTTSDEYGTVPENNRTEDEVAKQQKNSLLWEENVGNPKASGVGYIMFSTRAARSAFYKKFSTGIDISKKKVNQNNGFSMSKLAFWKKKKTEEDLSGNAVNKSKNIVYEFQKERAMLANVDILGLTSLRVDRMSYEPEDVDWQSVFQRNSLGGAGRFFRPIAIWTFLILVFLFVTTPAAATSGLQEILQIRQISVAADWAERFFGVFGSFFFQYLPALIVLIASVIIPIVIVKLTIAEKRISHSVTQRKIQQRIYLYLLLSVLILPSFALTAINGAFQYFSQPTPDVIALFGNVFVPNAGVFFVNYIVHAALLGNTLDLYKIGNMIKYFITARFTSPFWMKTPLARYLPPTDRLQAAEIAEMQLAMEYASMHLIISMALTYSVFQPIILVSALLFFLYKYYVDRYAILYVYGHRKKNSLYGAAFGFKTDFIAHYRCATQQVLMIWGSLFTFSFLQGMFYATKIVQDRNFIPHCVILLLCSAICLAMIPVTRVFLRRRRKSIVKQHNLKNGTSDAQIDPIEFQKMYEPCNTYPFLPTVSLPMGTPIVPSQV